MMPNQSCGQYQRGQQGRAVSPYGQQQMRQGTAAGTQARGNTSSCPSGQMSREQLLKKISLTKFAMVEANLYLDTHPDDKEAICYFQEHSRMYREAMDEYAKAYGPLTIAHAHHNDAYWDWVNQPWPWQ